MSMVTEWPGDDDPQHPYPAAERLAAASSAPKWPSTLAGYAKTLAVTLATVPPATALIWLQSAGVTHLYGWVTPVLTVVLGILAVLFGPRNRAS